MAYEYLSYSIKERMPHWWSEDKFLEPINRYTQELIRDLVGGLLGSFGVVQPVQVWKSLPTEYSWIKTYDSYDKMLKTLEGGLSPCYLNSNTPIKAYFPNSKRNCHGVIKLQLQGDQQGLERPLKKLSIKNVNQEIIFNNITTLSTIEIFTEDNTILIDGIEQSNLVKGRLDKIYPQAINTNYDEVDIDDENKETYIQIESSDDVYFELKVKMIHPVYVTEQCIRVHTVSAFPIESIKLFGFFCNDFSNKQEWRFLWEKQYNENDRVVYDMITKQFDCETFYVQVKLYGIGAPLVYGFPQEEFASNAIFQTNQNLDKWGKIYGLPRRHYKKMITEEEERYTYPPFYNYDIEQDYWYEERLVNEYRHNDYAINSALIKDSNLDNIAILKCIDPRIQDIYVYTETIKGGINTNHIAKDILPDYLDEEGEGVTWQTPHEVVNTTSRAAEITLEPTNSKSINTKNNQTKILKIFFKDNIPSLPKNIKITGLELELDGLTDIHSSSLTMDNRSKLLISNYYEKKSGEIIEKIDSVQINTNNPRWEKGKKTYKIGGQNFLFNLNEITREQLQNGIEFDLAFTNLNDFIKATLVLYNIRLLIYYETIKDSYDMEVILNKNEITLSDDSPDEILMKIKLKNNTKIPATNKKVNIIGAQGIDISKTTFPIVDLDENEEFIIGDNDFDEIKITPSEYERLSLSNGTSIHQVFDLTNNDKINFHYKPNGACNFTITLSSLTNYDFTYSKTFEYREPTDWNNFEYKFAPQNDLTLAEVLEALDYQIEIQIDVIETDGSLLIQDPENWLFDDSNPNITISREIKTGYFDIIVFCNEKVIKKEIIVKQGLNEDEIIGRINLTGDKEILSCGDNDILTLNATVLNNKMQPMENVSVNFFNGSSLIGTALTNSLGVATQTYSATGAGDITITASINNQFEDTYNVYDYLFKPKLNGTDPVTKWTNLRNETSDGIFYTHGGFLTNGWSNSELWQLDFDCMTSSWYYVGLMPICSAEINPFTDAKGTNYAMTTWEGFGYTGGLGASVVNEDSYSKNKATNVWHHMTIKKISSTQIEIILDETYHSIRNVPNLANLTTLHIGSRDNPATRNAGGIIQLKNIIVEKI